MTQKSIKQWREEMGMSVGEIASAVGLSVKTYVESENGQRSFLVPEIERVLAKLNLKASQINFE